MARANPGARVAAGFPIVDAATLRLRVAEYRVAEKRVDQAIGELNRLRAHIVKRAFALAEKGGLGVLNGLPVEWVAEEYADQMAAESDARIRARLAEIQAAGSAPFTHSMAAESQESTDG